MNLADTGLRVRAEPSVDSEAIGTFSPGAVGTIIGLHQTTDDQHIWYKIEIQTGDTGATIVGWVRSDTVTPVSECTTPVAPTVMVVTGNPSEVPGVPDTTNSCRGVIPNYPDGVNVFTDPTINSVVVAHVPSNATVEILTQQTVSTSVFPGLWYFVTAYPDGVMVQGWIRAELVALSSPCQGLAGQPPCVESYLITLPSPTPNPDVQSVELTATFIIVGATGTAQAVSTTPCIITPTPVGYQNVPLGATPTAGLDSALRSGGYDLIIVEQVGEIPSGTVVRLSSAYFTGTEWIYGILTQDGRTAQVHEAQLAPLVTATVLPPSLVPSATFTATPTPAS